MWWGTDVAHWGKVQQAQSKQGLNDQMLEALADDASLSSAILAQALLSSRPKRSGPLFQWDLRSIGDTIRSTTSGMIIPAVELG
jgi:hypothetical protein